MGVLGGSAARRRATGPCVVALLVALAGGCSFGIETTGLTGGTRGDGSPDAWVSTRDSGADVKVAVDGGADGSADGTKEGGAVCSAQDSRCVGNAVETCTSAAQWAPAVACVNQVCIETTSNGSTTAACVGSCAPDQTRCDGAMTGVQTCGADGTWGASALCGGSTCVTTMGDAGSSASCQGLCSQGETRCSGGLLESCTAAGTFGNGMSCGKMTCIPRDGGAACTGSCTPGTYQCGTGQQPQACNSSGMWVDNGTACKTNTCVPGAMPSCEGTCIAGEPVPCNCGNSGTAMCSSDGTPGTCIPGPMTCLAGSTRTCSTCGTLPGFGTGNQTCSKTTCTEGECVPPTGTNWSVNGNPATGFTHACGSTLLGDDWYLAGSNAACEMQAGPNATLSAGNYTATFTIASVCNEAPCPAQGTTVGGMQVGHGSPVTTDVSKGIALGTNGPVTYSLPFTVSTDCTTDYTFRVFANFPATGSYTLDITGTSLTYNGP